jgi:hypothetical protein
MPRKKRQFGQFGQFGLSGLGLQSGYYFESLDLVFDVAFDAGLSDVV